MGGDVTRSGIGRPGDSGGINRIDARGRERALIAKRATLVLKRDHYSNPLWKGASTSTHPVLS